MSSKTSLLTPSYHPGYHKVAILENGNLVYRYYSVKDILPMIYKEKDHSLDKLFGKKDK